MTGVHKFGPIVTVIKIPAVSSASMLANNNICGSALIESDFIGWLESNCHPQVVAIAAPCSNAVESIQSVSSINLVRQNDYSSERVDCKCSDVRMLSNNCRFVIKIVDLSLHGIYFDFCKYFSWKFDFYILK